MASIFQKSDPKDESVKRWMGKVKVGEEWRAFSLRLRAIPGTKREAQQRVDSLQVEIMAGVLSAATRAWLGDVTANKLLNEIGRGHSKIVSSGPASWESSALAWLKACDPKDTRGIKAGRVKAEEKTKRARKYKVKQFVDWAIENRVPFMAKPFTDTAIEFLQYRQAAGISANTLWNGDFSMVCTWGEWMACRKLCEPVNRDRLREIMPGRHVPDIVLPDWRADLANLRFFHQFRSYDRAWAKDYQGRNRWKTLKSRHSAWQIVLVVRGLGCRPSEATAMSWETVDLTNGKVKFIDSKNARSRVVPILLQWVLDGLTELWEFQGRPTDGPVCRTTKGLVWADDCTVTNMIQETSRKHGKPYIRLKELQKLQIAQLIRHGFPPHVVAHWSDHSLSVQERHYYEGDSYLPPEDGYDFAEFGTLSEYGQRVLTHQGAFSRGLTVE